MGKPHLRLHTDREYWWVENTDTGRRTWRNRSSCAAIDDAVKGRYPFEADDF